MNTLPSAVDWLPSADPVASVGAHIRSTGTDDGYYVVEFVVAGDRVNFSIRQRGDKGLFQL